MPVAPSNVEVLKSWTTGHLTGKKQRVRVVKITNAAGGDDTDTIPASSLSLTVIESALPLTYGSRVYLAVPSRAGDKLYLYNPASPAAPTAVTFGGADETAGFVTVTGQ
jgi:hypothetical protein